MKSYRIEEILNSIKSPVFCIINQKEREYVFGHIVSGETLKKDVVQGKNLEYEIQGITTEEDKVILSVKINLIEPNSPDTYSKWIKEYIEKMGKNKAFFEVDWFAEENNT